MQPIVERGSKGGQSNITIQITDTNTFKPSYHIHNEAEEKLSDIWRYFKMVSPLLHYTAVTNNE